MRTSIKPHACCRYKQGPIDCILRIARENGLTGDAVDKVTVAVLRAGVALVADPPEAKARPATIVDAQFSMPFGAAIAILRGNAFLDEYFRSMPSDIMKRVALFEAITHLRRACKRLRFQEDGWQKKARRFIDDVRLQTDTGRVVLRKVHELERDE